MRVGHSRWLLSLGICVAAATAARASTFAPREPLAFERNNGQHDAAIAFVGRASTYSVVLDTRGAAIAVPVRRDDKTTGTLNSRIGFARASGPSAIDALDPVPGVSNFFQGTSAITDVPSYARVAYRGVYPGIDAVFRASATSDLEIDFLVAPGAATNVIALDLEGAWAMTPSGDLHVCAGDADLTLHRPVAHQVIAGAAHSVAVSYRAGADGTVRLEIGAYDPAYPLVIDPALSYATAIAKVRTINDIAVDKNQNAYVVGSTVDSTFTTTPGAFQTTYQGTEDAVIIKYNKAGQRIFATFLGAADVIDRAIAVTVDDQQAIYVTGWTSVGYDSTTGQARFPITPGAYQSPPYVDGPELGSDDVFVTKLTPSGSALAFSSLVGGSGVQDPTGIALGPDPARNVYVTGHVQGPPNNPSYAPFPTTGGAYRSTISGDPTTFGNTDSFVFELSNNGSTLVASTLFGGRKGDDASALAVDSKGDVWVTGSTYSFDFPKTANGYRRIFVGPTVTSGGFTFSYTDVYVVKFDAGLTQLKYGTYLPGSSQNNSDVPWDITTDPDDNAYVVGFTPSDDFPTTAGAYKTATHGGFLTKFNAAGQVVFSTVLGGTTPSNGQTQITGVRTSGDVVFISGWTDTTDFATKGPIQAASGGGRDMFVCALNGTGNLLEFSTFLGGNGADSSYGLALDEASNLYMVGSSSSTNFPYSANAAEPAGSGFNTVYVKVSADRDEDGLLDWWELSGIDANGDGTIDLDLAALGAKVDHKDVFVEIDYMTAATHDHDPRTLPSGSPMSPSAIAPVVTAFANAPVTNPDGTTGIVLHALIDESIPEQSLITVDGENSDFNKIKLGSPRSPCGTAHFGTVADRGNTTNCQNIIKAKRRVYRYALFAHRFAEMPGSTGIAELTGNDLVVALEVREPWDDYEDKANLYATTYGTSLTTEWRDMLAGTFMHELGHTLGLVHGGGFGQTNLTSRLQNCKPNYISVMNYTRQVNKAGLAPGTSGPKIRTGRLLDYSSSVLPILSEGALVEGNGVGGPAGTTIVYGEGTSGIARLAPATGAIDWNGTNGIQATPVSADINKIANILLCNFNSPGELLEGHDDWSNLVYNFRLSADYADGTSLPIDLPEMTDADISGAMLDTQPPAVAITAPAEGARFAAGANIAISATATDTDGSIASVHFIADSDLLTTDTTSPYGTTWSNAPTGTHVVRVNAVDNLGAASSKQVTIHVGCTPSFTPSSAAIAYDAGGGSFDMSLPAGCRWTAVSDAGWLLLTPHDGDGSATFAYTAADNTTASTRTATVTIAGQTFVVTQDPPPPFGAPTGVVATGTGAGTPTISLSWHGTAGVANYEIALSSNGTTYTTVGTTSDQFFDITTGVSANAAYLVKVRAIASGGAQSAYSSADLASTFIFTDDPLQVGVTTAKSVHWTELRTAINAVRQVAGLTSATWTANVAVGQVITKLSVDELRTALDGARSALGLAALTYTDSPLTTQTPIRAVHLTQLRGGVQ